MIKIVMSLNGLENLEKQKILGEVVLYYLGILWVDY